MSELKFRLVGALGKVVVSALFATIRIHVEGAEHHLGPRRSGQPVVFVFWHGQLLPLVHVHRGEGVVVLVSEHADGEYVTRLMERHGLDTARGSSTRGAAKGLKGLIRAARAGRDLALTPDGPRGPGRVFKPGALLAAQVTGHQVVPIGIGCSGAWHLDSWDRFLVPRPFSKLQVVYGEGRTVPRDAERGVLERLATELGREMDVLTERAEALARA